jgi:anaerobic selenocysteine-containing dehydrogenase
MRYSYKGFWGCDSWCGIEVHRRSDGKYVFVATEVQDNPG